VHVGSFHVREVRYAPLDVSTLQAHLFIVKLIYKSLDTSFDVWSIGSVIGTNQPTNQPPRRQENP